MSDAYAELYENNHAGSIINIPVAGAFVKWVTSTVGLAGPTDLSVPSAATDDITIGPNGAGVYGIFVSSAFRGSPNSIVEACVFLNGALENKLSTHRKLSPAGDEGVISLSGLLALVHGDVVDLRFTSDGNGDIVDVTHVNLTIFTGVRAV